MSVYDPEGLLKVHHEQHAAHEHAAHDRPSGTHPLHLGVAASARRAKRRLYIHYTLRHQALRHGVVARSYA